MYTTRIVQVSGRVRAARAVRRDRGGGTDRQTTEQFRPGDAAQPQVQARTGQDQRVLQTWPQVHSLRKCSHYCLKYTMSPNNLFVNCNG